MKKLALLGLMLALLVSSVSAFSFTLSDSAPTARETETITLTLTTNVSVTFSDNVNFGTLTPISGTQATYSYSPGIDNTSGSRQFVVQFTATDVNDSSNKMTQTATLTYTDVSRMQVRELDIKVGSSSDRDLENEVDGYRISEEAEPGDSLSLDVEVANLFSDDEDIEIRDVQVEVTITNIDDGDDIECESDEEDIEADKDESFSVDDCDDVPLRVDEGDYDFEILITGRDELGNSYEYKRTFLLEVDKENHDVRVERAQLRPATLSCAMRSELDVLIVNYGADEEEEIRITAKNADLGLDFEEFDDGDIELDTGADDDAEYALTVPIDAANARVGRYPIVVSVYRDERTLEDSETLELTITECRQTTDDDMNDSPSQPSQDDDTVDVVVTPTQPTAPTTPVTPQQPVYAQVQGDSFEDSSAYTVLLVSAAIVLILLIATILVLLFKKRD